MKRIKFVILLLMFSCGIFEPRTPEDPVLFTSDYPPATSSDILLNNFQAAFTNLHSEIFSSNFVESSNTYTPFGFIPTANINTLYPGLFNHWTVQNEARVLKTISNSIEEGKKPYLSLTYLKYETSAADSAVISCDYLIKIQYKNKAAEDSYAGSMYLTMYPQSNGIWRISKWMDMQTLKDSADKSWSYLKAIFSN